jgi:hypothetical protein
MGLDGRDDFGCRGEELHPTTVTVSEVAACGGELDIGDSGRKSASSSADSGRLPGMVSRPERVTGGDEWIAALISWWTEDVSHLSKALSTDIVSTDGNMAISTEDWLEYRVSLVLDVPAPTLVADDLLVEESLPDTGVIGGELSVMSCDPNDRLVLWVAGLVVDDMDGALARKSMFNLLARCETKTLRAHTWTRQYKVIFSTDATAHMANHIPITVVCGAARILAGRSFSLVTSQTNATPEAMIVTAAVPVAQEMRHQVHAFVPRACRCSLFTKMAQNPARTARSTRPRAKAT